MARARPTEFPRGEPLLLLAVLILVLYFARELLIPLAFALSLAFLLGPAVERLERIRLPRLPAIALVGVVACVLVSGVGYVVARQLLHVAQTLPIYRLTLQKKIASVHSPTERSIEKALDNLEDIGADLAHSAAPPAPVVWPNAPNLQPQPVRVVPPDGGQLQATGQMALTLLKPIGTVAVVIVFTIYMLLKREELRNRLLLLAGMGHISIMTQALQDAATRISQYLVLQAAVNAAYGLCFGVGLYFIGVPDATLWGVLAAILRVIPYVGTATSLIFPLIVSFALPSPWAPLLVLALFLALELTVTNFLEPWLYGSRTGISSLALLAMAIFWALLWGWPGLVLSTPLTVCMVVLGRYVPQMSFLHTLLGTDAELSADAHFYERLLAMDQPEAHAIADRFLEGGKSLVELYDTVVIPALSLAEQDRHQGALDDARSNFLFLSIGELIAELTNYQPKNPVDTIPSDILPNGDLPVSIPPTHNLQNDHASANNRPNENALANQTTRDTAPASPATSVNALADQATGNATPANPATSVNGLADQATGNAASANRATSDNGPSHRVASDNAPGDQGPSVNIPANRPVRAPVRPAPVRKEFAVVCISASDQADELTALMLAQLMEQADHSTLLLTADTLSNELLDTLAKEPDTVVFISALPPFAFSHARSICQRVRAHLPSNRICIGFWNTPDDPEQTIERFGNGRPNVVLGTLSQALQQVAQWQE
jgi:predicted PurR-regulated permease PerM